MVLLDLAYLTLATLLAPVLAYVWVRKPRVRQNLRQRLGLDAALRGGDRPCVWLHGVSVGEVLALRPLVKALRGEMPEVELILSTSTTTGEEVARKHLPDVPCFPFPLDLSWTIDRVLAAKRPTVVALMERELWPNFLLRCERRRVPVVVVNGRLSERSARRYGLIGPVARRLFRCVTRFLVQNETYRARLAGLGVESDKLAVTGSLKYDALPTAPDVPSVRAEMRAALGIPGDALVVVGGSTHPGEESALVAALRRLRAEGHAARLIVVPRHNERAADVEAAIVALGERAIRKTELERASAGGSPAEGSPLVIVGDTMGELMRIYAAADLVFVGGSLVPRGGQNMLEPCALGLPVVFGSRVESFRESADLLLVRDAAVEVATPEALAETLAALARDPKRARAMGERARAAVEAERGAVARTVAELRAVLAAHGAVCGRG